jgi:hypothetical protein
MLIPTLIRLKFRFRRRNKRKEDVSQHKNDVKKTQKRRRFLMAKHPENTPKTSQKTPALTNLQNS